MCLLNYLTLSTLTTLRQWISRSNALYSLSHVEEQISGRQEKEIFLGPFGLSQHRDEWMEGRMDELMDGRTVVGWVGWIKPIQ